MLTKIVKHYVIIKHNFMHKPEEKNQTFIWCNDVGKPFLFRKGKQYINELTGSSSWICEGSFCKNALVNWTSSGFKRLYDTILSKSVYQDEQQNTGKKDRNRTRFSGKFYFLLFAEVWKRSVCYKWKSPFNFPFSLNGLMSNVMRKIIHLGPN